MANSQPAPNTRKTLEARAYLVDGLTAAAWLGLVTGLVEGGGKLALQHLGWLSWDLAQLSVSADIIWIAAILDALVFASIALVMVVASRAGPIKRDYSKTLCT
ncbi:MAG TPA: hypothetical protein VGQ71_02645 [Terriglobales bacterium]|jgi:hypothetical protein|nr:hypothetical protein [Terriglobales bacterium]